MSVSVSVSVSMYMHILCLPCWSDWGGQPGRPEVNLSRRHPRRASWRTRGRASAWREATTKKSGAPNAGRASWPTKRKHRSGQHTHNTHTHTTKTHSTHTQHIGLTQLITKKSEGPNAGRASWPTKEQIAGRVGPFNDPLTLHLHLKLENTRVNS